MENITPKKEPLRFIRGKYKKLSKGDEKIANGIDVSRSGMITQKVPFSKAEAQKEFSLFGSVNLIKVRKFFSFNTISQILWTISLILAIYLVADFLIITPGKIKEKSLMLTAKSWIPEMPSMTLPRPFSYYSQPAKSRNIFSSVSLKRKQVSSSLVFNKATPKLKLQGIIAGANPQAIVEDIKTGRVYFLSLGERIGEIELKQILPGKVKLDYRGQEVELSL